MEVAENVEKGVLDLLDSVNKSNVVLGNSTNPFLEDDFTDNWGPSEEIKKEASDDTSSCKQILFEGITSTSTVRAWDILILIPNLCFFAFLLLYKELANSLLYFFKTQFSFTLKSALLHRITARKLTAK